MNTGRRTIPRSTLLAVALVGFVVACGFGGMLVGPHLLHQRAASAASAASGSGPRIAGGAELHKPVPRSPAAPSKVASGRAPSTEPVVVPGPKDVTPGAVTDDQEIRLALRRWQEALLSNDAKQIAPSYAEEVDRYFLRTHVDREFVYRYMAKQEDRGSWLLAYDLRDVQVEHAGADLAEVRFAAEFTVSTGKGERSGSARTELKMRREDGDWKIYSERDFRP